MVIPISDKIEFISKKVTKDTEGNYILIKISTKQDDITIYAPKNRSSDYEKQKLTELRGEMDSSTVTVRDFNIPLSIMDRTTRQKISKKIEDLNDTVNQIDITDICRIIHPTTTEYTFS